MPAKLKIRKAILKAVIQERLVAPFVEHNFHQHDRRPTAIQLETQIMQEIDLAVDLIYNTLNKERVNL